MKLRLFVFLAVLSAAIGNLPAQSTTSSSATGTNAWTTTTSGLRYQVLVKGEGKVSPQLTDLVTVSYEGKNADGSVFNTSTMHGGTVQVHVSDIVPKGWQEGVQLMHVGDKFNIEVPPGLGYGDKAPRGVAANGAVTFTTELVKIN